MTQGESSFWKIFDGAHIGQVASSDSEEVIYNFWNAHCMVKCRG